MHHPYRQFFSSLMLVLGMLVCMSVGQVALADSEEPPVTQAVSNSTPKAAVPSLSGQQVYNNVCIACHSPPGVGGAPALGDAAVWAPRIIQGMDVLIDHALNGFSGSTGVMPKKGERLDLSDEEIVRAVQYMVEEATQ